MRREKAMRTWTIRTKMIADRDPINERRQITKMKKLISILLITVLALCLASCGGSKEKSDMETIKKAGVIRIGMECEYMPSYDGFIRSLVTDYGMEFLLLGQHIYEHADGSLGFFDSEETKRRLDMTGLGEAMIAGIRTGLFEAVAHPDRIFRRRDGWGEEEAAMAKRIIAAAMEQDIPLEVNMESRAYPEYNFYQPEFWKLVPPECRIIYGVDAHAVQELVDGTAMIRKIIKGEAD